MAEIIASSVFDDWLNRLRDGKGRAIVAARIERFAAGNPGDVKPVGEGISEMRIAFGPGFEFVPTCGKLDSSLSVIASRLFAAWRSRAARQALTAGLLDCFGQAASQ